MCVTLRAWEFYCMSSFFARRHYILPHPESRSGSCFRYMGLHSPLWSLLWLRTGRYTKAELGFRVVEQTHYCKWHFFTSSTDLYRASSFKLNIVKIKSSRNCLLANVCPRHCAKCFTCMIPFDPHNPRRWESNFHITDGKTKEQEDT